MSAPKPDRAGTPRPDEEGGLASTGRRDLISAMVVGALALAAGWMSLTMENPGRTVFVAPGLLPFLVSVTLFAMAAAQGWKAARGGGARRLLKDSRGAGSFYRDGENRSVLLLIALVVAYAVLVDVLTFDPRIPLGFGGLEIRFSSFEAITIVMVGVILRIFWKKPLPLCFLVSFLTSTALALCFRIGFELLMPGSG